MNFRASNYIMLLLPLIVLGCASNGSRPPDVASSADLSIAYCRVELAEHEMHAQWASDHAARGEVLFGQSGYSDTIRVTAYQDTQDVALPGIAWNAVYLYRIALTDSEGHTAICDGVFSTPEKASPEPAIIALRLDHLTESSVRVSWRTDEPATTVLRFGTSAILDDSLTTDSLTIDHRILLYNLTPLSSYHLRAEGVDSSGLRGIGEDTTIVTAAPAVLAMPDTTVNVGDTIRFPITIAGAVDIAAMRVALTFSPGALEILTLDEGSFYSANGGFLFLPDVRNEAGRAVVDIAWTITYEGEEPVTTAANGDGAIIAVTLRALTPGTWPLSLDEDSSFSLDIFAVQHACSLQTGTIEVLP
jgi:hypothetical protein